MLNNNYYHYDHISGNYYRNLYRIVKFINDLALKENDKKNYLDTKSLLIIVS
ncbi:putative phage abortive infection protein [Salipaludibacillus sp. CF4.18]|uniref:putative phage abortive infection protein n=1 Tax=Salipaludibacillus sp. CF4.18 TaxID=3373081 RepID=UPI003EE4DE18